MHEANRGTTGSENFFVSCTFRVIRGFAQMKAEPRNARNKAGKTSISIGSNLANIQADEIDAASRVRVISCELYVLNALSFVSFSWRFVCFVVVFLSRD